MHKSAWFTSSTAACQSDSGLGTTSSLDLLPQCQQTIQLLQVFCWDASQGLKNSPIRRICPYPHNVEVWHETWRTLQSVRRHDIFILEKHVLSVPCRNHALEPSQQKRLSLKVLRSQRCSRSWVKLWASCPMAARSCPNSNSKFQAQTCNAGGILLGKTAKYCGKKRWTTYKMIN